MQEFRKSAVEKQKLSTLVVGIYFALTGLFEKRGLSPSTDLFLVTPLLGSDATSCEICSSKWRVKKKLHFKAPDLLTRKRDCLLRWQSLSSSSLSIDQWKNLTNENRDALVNLLTLFQRKDVDRWSISLRSSRMSSFDLLKKGFSRYANLLHSQLFSPFLIQSLLGAQQTSLAQDEESRSSWQRREETETNANELRQCSTRAVGKGLSGQSLPRSLHARSFGHATRSSRVSHSSLVSEPASEGKTTDDSNVCLSLSLFSGERWKTLGKVTVGLRPMLIDTRVRASRSLAKNWRNDDVEQRRRNRETPANPHRMIRISLSPRLSSYSIERILSQPPKKDTSASRRRRTSASQIDKCLEAVRIAF